MKKIALAFAALTAAAVALPTMASAERIVIREGGDYGYRGARAQVHVDRGYHRGWYHRSHRPDRVVIIKRHRHHHWD
jgi:hypothetical protein